MLCVDAMSARFETRFCLPACGKSQFWRSSFGSLTGKENTEIFGLFLDPNLNHFKDIESVLSVMARAGVAIRVFRFGHFLKNQQAK